MKNLFSLILIVTLTLIGCQKEEEQPVSNTQDTTADNSGSSSGGNSGTNSGGNTGGNTGGGQTTSLSSCDYNKGYFSVTVDGTTYEMNPDSVTQYMIMYDYYQQNYTAFHFEGKDINGGNLMMTFWINNPFQLGSHTYSENNGNLMDFDVWTSGNSVSLPSAELNMQEANLVFEGANIYRSAIGSFSGLGITTPPPGGTPDTLNVEGEFCLNGWYQ